MDKAVWIAIDDLIADWSVDPEFAAAMDAARIRRAERIGAAEVQATGDI